MLRSTNQHRLIMVCTCTRFCYSPSELQCTISRLHMSSAGTNHRSTFVNPRQCMLTAIIGVSQCCSYMLSMVWKDHQFVWSLVEHTVVYMSIPRIQDMGIVPTVLRTWGLQWYVWNMDQGSRIKSPRRHPLLPSTMMNVQLLMVGMLLSKLAL